MWPEQLEKYAQQAAEQRLGEGWAFLDEENDGATLDAPFCGCDTCVVREAILAAWPYLYQLAHHPETEVPQL